MKKSDILFLLIITIIVLGTLGGYKLLTSFNSLAPYEKYFVKEQKEQNVQSTQVIRATFLGTSSILISDGETTLLTDGFISRPSLAKLLLSKIESDKLKINDVLKKLNIKNIDALVTLHSHHDHALDSAYVAKQTNAFLIGSSSTANIARGFGFDETKIKIVRQKQSFEFGKFKITVLPSKHTVMPSLLNKVVGMGGNINKPLKKPSYFTKFKEGGTYSLFIEHPLGNIFINASTGYAENQLEKYTADVVFLGIANLGKQTPLFQEKYFNEIVTKLNASRIIPIHWDDFMRDINKPTRTMNKLFDDFNSSMGFLIEKSEQNGIKLEMLNIFDEVVLYKRIVK